MSQNGSGNPGDTDELISQFMAFTGSSDASKAASYLEMSGNNVETAVGLYLEHEQGGGGGGGEMGGIGGGGASGGGGGGGGMMGDEVRAPDATQRMQLMDDHPMGMMPPYAGLAGSSLLMNAMMDEEFAHQSAFAAPSRPVDARGVVNAAAAAAAREEQNGDAQDDDAKENAQGADSEEYEDADAVPSRGGGSGAARLADMFAPPTHLIHKAGGFQGARQMAKDSKRWLLVNIQRDSEFSSHALNRDVWRDELVENLVRAGFIFWQQMDTTAEGRTYTGRYQVKDYPHIAIIDPRTGRLLWRKEGWTQVNPLTAEIFAETAMDFCSRNSFDRPPQAPRPAAGAAAGRPAKRPMHEMSEAEQLQAAMRASMEDVKGNVDDSGEVVYVDSDNDDGELDTKAEEDAKMPATPSLNDELLAMELPDEPADGARIQLRMPDGKRVVRKFATFDSVKMIYAFIAHTNEDASDGKEFTAMAGFPPSDLIDKINETIEASGLSGQVVTVRWK